MWRAFALAAADDPTFVLPRSGAQVRICFELYDTDQDHTLSYHEMNEFFLSLFSMTLLFEPHDANIDPKTLARVATRKAFEDADTDGNGVLSFTEFKSW